LNGASGGRRPRKKKRNARAGRTAERWKREGGQGKPAACSSNDSRSTGTSQEQKRGKKKERKKRKQREGKRFRGEKSRLETTKGDGVEWEPVTHKKGGKTRLILFYAKTEPKGGESEKKPGKKKETGKPSAREKTDVFDRTNCRRESKRVKKGISLGG